MLVTNQKFSQKSNCLSKNKNFGKKNRNFVEKKKTKFVILVKNPKKKRQNS